MIVDGNVKSKYPKLAKWLKNELPKAARKPRVWKAFLKYSELSAVKATAALKSGTKPTLCGKVLPGANGEFHGSANANKIFLAEAICKRFEKESRKKKMLLLVESTVLHEMVHWGDWMDGKDQAGEEGKQFEKAAYGKDICRYW